MNIGAVTSERKPILSIKDTIQLALSFGMFVIALVKLFVDLNKKDQNK